MGILVGKDGTGEGNIEEGLDERFEIVGVRIAPDIIAVGVDADKGDCGVGAKYKPMPDKSNTTPTNAASPCFCVVLLLLGCQLYE